MDGSTKDLKDTYGVGGPVFCFPVGPGVVTGQKNFLPSRTAGYLIDTPVAGLQSLAVSIGVSNDE